MLILFLIAFIGALFIQPASSVSDSIEISSINRTIHITYHKIFQVMDNYTILNKGSDPISSILIEFPYEYISKITTFDVFGNNLEKLTFNQLPYDGSKFSKWQIFLNNPLLGGQTVVIKNIITFIGITSDYSNTAIDGVKGHILFNFVKYPSSPYYIRNCSVTITCDPKVSVYDSNTNRYFSTLKLVSKGSVLKNNITAYNSRFNLTEPTQYGQYSLSSVKFPYIEREIQIDLWGYMYVYEEHCIENFGPYGNFRIIMSFFHLPSNAENIYVYDKFGSLAYGITGDASNDISINFDATRYTLGYHETTVYWVTYRIPLSEYIQQTGDKLKLNFDILYGSYEGLVENFEVTLILPKIASLNNLIPSAASIHTHDNQIVLIFNESNVSPYNSKIIQLELDYSHSYLDFLWRPLTIFFILAILCSAFVLVKRGLPTEKRISERSTVVPTPIIMEFCSLFDEKVSLITELEKLEEDVIRRKIKKRIYRNRFKNAERKLFELDKDINELKIVLKQAGGRFAEIVNELEINEAERESAKDGVRNLDQRYQRKKISTVAYQKLYNDLINRHKKAKTRIDKLIFELREILS